jgi:hypothetical protein
MFPEGIEDDRKNDEYRTFRVNQFSSYSPTIVGALEHKKTGYFRNISKKPGSVRMERLELSHLAALDPKSSVSTNSTTSAFINELSL